MKSLKSNPFARLQYEMEKSLNATIDKKFKKMKFDLNNLILGVSRNGHSRNLGFASKELWHSQMPESENQIIVSLGAALQKSVLRNL